MIQYIVAGLVLGGAYALTAVGVATTYKSAGILNFSFGAMAFFVARTFYFLHIEQGWHVVLAAVLAVLVVGPVLGVVLWALLFRQLQMASTVIKVVATIGLSVALPAVTEIIYGDEPITSSPGLAPVPVAVYDLLGVAITADQLIVLLAVLVTAVAGVVVLRLTDVGLMVRAVVDSRAMTAISGTDPRAVSAGVWAASAFLAGLVGVLLAPVIGLEPTSYISLMAVSFAAVVAAKLIHLGRASLFGVLLGIGSSLIDWRVDASSAWSPTLKAATPFVLVVVALIVYARRGGTPGDGAVGGPLDRAIALSGGAAHQPAGPKPSGGPRSYGLIRRRVRIGGTVVAYSLIGALPFILTGYWSGLVGLGLALGIAFLSFTVTTGQGGMIWLCQITFAGLGAVLTAQLTTTYGWPLLPAVGASGLGVAVVGLLIGLLTVRMGSLYVALVTLSFAMLIDQSVFLLEVFDQFGAGVVVPRPDLAESDRAFAVMVFVLFCLAASLIAVLRRSTAGAALQAVRGNAIGALALGVDVIFLKVVVSGAGAFLAAAGGGLVAAYGGVALPTSYLAIGGLVWLAVLVTSGARSSVAAAIAGLALGMLPAVVLAYLPASWGQVPAALFGLGAILAVRHPDGVVTAQARAIEGALTGIVRRCQTSLARPPDGDGPVPALAGTAEPEFATGAGQRS